MNYPPNLGPYQPAGYLDGGPVNFGEAISHAFRNGFVYRGRASRSAFWWFILFETVFIAALNLIISASGGVRSGASGAILLIVLYILISYIALVSLALLVRRFHDIDRSGWWVLVSYVPLVGLIVLLVFTLQEGTPRPNRYQP